MRGGETGIPLSLIVGIVAAVITILVGVFLIGKIGLKTSIKLINIFRGLFIWGGGK